MYLAEREGENDTYSEKLTEDEARRKQQRLRS
jgi:hypothetical protein